MAEVIKLVEKLSVAHQLTATLTPSTTSMMSDDNNCFGVDRHVILPASTLMPNFMAVKNLATLPRSAPQNSSIRKHQATTADLI